jgi:hypothetical protein
MKKRFFTFALFVCAGFALFAQNAGDFTTKANDDGTLSSKFFL